MFLLARFTSYDGSALTRMSERLFLNLFEYITHTHYVLWILMDQLNNYMNAKRLHFSRSTRLGCVMCSEAACASCGWSTFASV